jgi:hypothetical protein
MILHLATSCFPNCHPTGTDPTALQQSGNAALGFAALIVVGVILKAILFGGKGKGGK